MAKLVKLSEQVLQIRELLLVNTPVKNIAKLFNISESTVKQIKTGKTWQSLGEFKIPSKIK